MAQQNDPAGANAPITVAQIVAMLQQLGITVPNPANVPFSIVTTSTATTGHLGPAPAPGPAHPPAAAPLAPPPAVTSALDAAAPLSGGNSGPPLGGHSSLSSVWNKRTAAAAAAFNPGAPTSWPATAAPPSSPVLPNATSSPAAGDAATAPAGIICPHVCASCQSPPASVATSPMTAPVAAVSSASPVPVATASFASTTPAATASSYATASVATASAGAAAAAPVTTNTSATAPGVPIAGPSALALLSNADSWYAVTVGRAVGVFQGWGVVEQLVSRVPGFSTRRYPTREAALAAFQEAQALGLVEVKP